MKGEICDRSPEKSTSSYTADENANYLPLHYRVNEKPKWSSALFLGFQQTMVCLSGVLVIPYVVADIACAGIDTIALRVQLISATFVATGLSTVFQSTFGLRLAVLQGPSFGFLPPLLAFSNLPEMKCNSSSTDFVPEEQYKHKLQIIQGSLTAAALVLILVGVTGIIGKISRQIGPITICPLLLLLCMSNIDTIVQDSKTHYISLIQFGLLLMLTLFLAEYKIPFPIYKNQHICFKKFRLFGLFPYLIALLITYMFALIMSKTDAISANSTARVDKDQAIKVLHSSPWFHIPYPGHFGMLKFNVGLFLGMLASAVACTVEAIGAYGVLAKVSRQRPVPSAALNRAIIMEGVGTLLAGLLGVCMGVTTYSENVAAISITRVASRFTMQIAGCFLIMLGLFTKIGALIATIPEPMIGGILAMGVSLVVGVAISNLQMVDLKLSRNLSILGVAITLGLSIPEYFTENPVDTGSTEVNQMLQILLTMQMFVGGFIAFILDLLVPGATREQRGFEKEVDEIFSDSNSEDCEEDGYALPSCIKWCLVRFPLLTKLPFFEDIENKERTENSEKESKLIKENTIDSEIESISKKLQLKGIIGIGIAD